MRNFLEFAFCVGLLSAAVLHAQEVDSRLDDQLFEELKQDLFSDLPAIQQEGETPGEVDLRLQRDLGGEDLGEVTRQQRSTNPLTKIAANMHRVRDRLESLRPDLETQQLQSRIVGNLDELIEALKQQPPPKGGAKGSPQQSPQQQAGTSKSGDPKQGQGEGKSSGKGQGKPSGNPSNNPAQDSTTRLGNADTAPVDRATRDQLMQGAWGNLPAAMRQQMQSSRPERFLPKYSQLIEDYFRELANEKEAPR